MEKELMEYYKKLDKNEKRNQISSELEKLDLLLNSVHQQFNIQKLPSSINIYNKVEDKEMSDDEFFNKMYENIIYIRKNILTLVNELMVEKNNIK